MKSGLKSIIFGCFILGAPFFSSQLQAQELKCELSLDGKKIMGVDPSVFRTMETSLKEFMNNTAFTKDLFSAEERIECSITITLTGTVAQDVYNANIIIQSSRPVFNSNYNSPMFNYRDKDCIINYVQNQSLDFTTSQYNSNLTSILGFYAYVIIGMDYESQAKGGGAKYFALAEQIMNNVPTNAAEAVGWRPFDDTHNRYWLINNLQASKYESFKEALWDYHFAGLDNFYDKPAVARQNIMNALDKLDKLAKDNPNGILISVFAQAKSDELVGIFSGAPSDEKAKALIYLREIDPSNSSKYEKLTKN